MLFRPLFLALPPSSGGDYWCACLFLLVPFQLFLYKWWCCYLVWCDLHLSTAKMPFFNSHNRFSLELNLSRTWPLWPFSVWEDTWRRYHNCRSQKEAAKRALTVVTLPACTCGSASPVFEQLLFYKSKLFSIFIRVCAFLFIISCSF